MSLDKYYCGLSVVNRISPFIFALIRMSTSAFSLSVNCWPTLVLLVKNMKQQQTNKQVSIIKFDELFLRCITLPQTLVNCL